MMVLHRIIDGKEAVQFLISMEESKKVQDQFLSSEDGGGHIKNLYLRDHKKLNILLVAEQDKQIDLKRTLSGYC